MYTVGRFVATVEVVSDIVRAKFQQHILSEAFASLAVHGYAYYRHFKEKVKPDMCASKHY